jgi:hypothetical protein
MKYGEVAKGKKRGIENQKKKWKWEGEKNKIRRSHSKEERKKKGKLVWRRKRKVHNL